MQKEKQVKSYNRKTKSGKVVTVKAHTAKYEAANAVDNKAKNRVSKKKGAGMELKNNPYLATAGLNVKDFKEWYNFNDWDSPQNTWPESVQIADKHIRAKLGSEEAYNKYCDKIDSDWKEGGYVKYHSAYKVNPRPTFPARVISKSVDEPMEKPVKKARTSKKKASRK